MNTFNTVDLRIDSGDAKWRLSVTQDEGEKTPNLIFKI